MSLPDVAQAEGLASEFGTLLAEYAPASVALLGSAGGNGLERVDAEVTRRVVALDINPAFMEVARARFAANFEEFEPIVCDLGTVDVAPFRPVDLLFAGLLLEYVPLRSALRFIRSALKAGAVFGCVIQQESPALTRVSPSPYASLSILAHCMKPLSPDDVRDEAGLCGLILKAERSLRMPNGKVLVSQTYLAE